MAYGLLGSIIPQIKQNTVVFTAPANTLAYGKVSISSKNPSPSKIRLGIGTNPVKYLEYNKIINYGEAFETNIIYFGNGEKLVVRSDNSDVNFVFYGETFDESLQPVKSGLVGIVTSTNNQKKLLYQVPNNAQGILSISVCNLGSQICKARIGISSVGLVGSGTSQYLEYDIKIGPNQTYTRTDLKLQENQSLTCSSDDNSKVNFVCYGRLIYNVNKLVVDGDTILQGNLGIGTTANGYRLRIEGNTFSNGSTNIGGSINVSGITTLGGLVDINNSVDISTDLNVTGVSTLGNTVVGGGTTQLVVTGNARITGILTIGTSSITLNGSNDQVNVGTGVTLHPTNGVQVGVNTLHSTGLTLNSLSVTGIATFNSETKFGQFTFGQIATSLLSS